MKAGIFGLLFLITVPIPGGLTSPVKEDVFPAVELEARAKYFVLETLTIYHPVAGQCDATPLITASNARIDIEKLRRQEIRWMALSRNLLKKWNGEFHYGDTVMLSAGDPEIDGLWVINDNMNKRFKDRGDLLFHGDTRKGGIWKNVKMAKWEAKEIAI
jgi:hypothetical protein